jgi:anti-anti-sigma factor
MEDVSVDEIWDYQTDHARIFVVRGELDAHLSADLRSRLEAALLGPSEALLIDLEDVTFMDAAALGDLVTVFKKARARGAATRLVAPSAAVRRLIHATETECVFPTHRNLIPAYGEIPRDPLQTRGPSATTRHDTGAGPARASP